MKDIGLLISAFGILGLVACYGATHGWNCRHKWLAIPNRVYLGLAACIPLGVAIMALGKLL